MSTATKTYEYVIRDRAGAKVTGRMEAANEAAVVARLRASGSAPISLKVAGEGMNREITLPFGNAVKTLDLAIMSRQFATMIGAGLPLLRALTILSEQTENTALAKVLREVRAGVESGESLSAGFAKNPRVFPPLMTNMTRAGEVGGFLDATLGQIAANYEAEAKLKAKVKSAMTYPVVVFAIAICAVIGMLLFIVPVFTKMFASLGAQLPAPTRVLVGMSHVLTTYWYLPVTLGIAFAVVWPRVRHREAVVRVVDPLRLKMPVFGQLTGKIAISRLSRNLGTMVRSGVPILQALDIVADTAGNSVVAQAVRACQDSVRTGGSISGPLADHPVIPPMVAQMMSVGEDTGALDTMLGKIAEFYDQQVEATTEALTSLIEPIMITVLGGVVGGMIVCLYMPIFSVMNAIK